MKGLFIFSKVTTIIILLFMPVAFLLENELFLINSLVMLPLFFILDYIFFSKHTNKYPLKISDELLKISFNIKKNENLDIIVKKEQGLWIFNLNNMEFEMDLKGYIYPKSFIRSFIIRQLRYSYANKERSIKKLFKINVYLSKYKSNNIVISYKLGDKIKSKTVLKQGMSKHTVLSQLISQTRFYKKYFFMKTISSFGETSERMSEKWYLSKK